MLISGTDSKQQIAEVENEEKKYRNNDIATDNEGFLWHVSSQHCMKETSSSREWFKVKCKSLNFLVFSKKLHNLVNYLNLVIIRIKSLFFVDDN